MIKCKVKKVNNFTTTTHAEQGAFDYIANGENNACSLMRDSLGSGQWSLVSKPQWPNMIKQPMVGSGLGATNAILG